MSLKYNEMTDEQLIELARKEYNSGKDELRGCEIMPLEQYIKFRVSEMKKTNK